MRLAFTDQMMKQVIARQKIATRRVIVLPRNFPKTWGDFDETTSEGRWLRFGDGRVVSCPYAEVGSVEHVRESVRLNRIVDGVRVQYLSDGLAVDIPFSLLSQQLIEYYGPKDVGFSSLIQPRFMHRVWARTYVRFTHTFYASLGDMKPADATEEGFADLRAFREYWDGRNAERGYAHRSDLRVWVIKFEFDRLLPRPVLLGEAHGD